MNSAVQSTNQANDRCLQFLTFLLGDEIYGVEILCVQEIRGWEVVREIPNTPEYVKGVLNLRGVIVPIVDLRVRFGLECAQYTPTTVTIVITVRVNEVNHTMGIVVDGVSDVLMTEINDIKPSPNMGVKVHTRFISGMVMYEDKVVVLVNPDKLLDPDELAELDSVVE